jgi:Caspase domain
MVRRARLIVLLSAVAFSAAAAAQRTPMSTCGATLETINWTREKLARPDVTEAALRPILSYLELSTQSCSTNGDLWYYRYIVERRLGAAAAKLAYSKKKAEDWHSEALARNIDPFAPAAAPPLPIGAIARKWALVVGIGDFNDSTIVPLSYTAKDARDLRNALTDRDVGAFAAERVRLLLDKDATLVKIREAIGWLRVNAGRDDLVLVYFASHGSPRQFDPNGVSYIIVHDTNPTNAETLYATGLQMIDLAEDLSRELRSTRVVLILDTCFSGDAAKMRLDGGATAFAPAFEGFARAPGRLIMAAANGDQPSWESAERQNGYFTFFLVEALRKKRAQTLQQLFDEVQKNVTISVQKELDKAQTPLMTGATAMKAVSISVAESAPPGL